jgi:hypothetical protein
VVTLDRRKFAAPVFAQAAAFVVVLAIGGFTGHSSTPTAGASAGPSQGPTHQASPSASSSTLNATKGHGAKLTVKVVEVSINDGGFTVAGSDVKVVQNGTLKPVVSGTLNTALEFAANVPAGAYQVCLNPPIGWTSADKSTHLNHGFICSVTDVGSGPVSVTFRLSPQTKVGL